MVDCFMGPLRWCARPAGFTARQPHGTFKCLSEHIPFSFFYKKKKKVINSRS
jgi:hypothetical protein